ncbi:recombinase family protein [Pararhizobium sp. DWP1-1-3]|uniref:recombinase family protein n=1 Tax=Pararhizobium sp. DWP1-1-3 TaxID=2804652 RepID=UPI003CED4C1F
MYVRAYLRASTKDQDASRAKDDLVRFVDERGLKIAAFYMENESGASLARPELFRLLSDCHPGDVLLVEQVDRLSRLNAEDWTKLKAEIGMKRVRVVALDLPTSYQLANSGDDFSSRMLDAVNGMMLDMLAAIARKDYEDRRRRQAQGIAKAKVKTGDERVYRGRPENEKRNVSIMEMLGNGQSWASIIAATGCSRSTLSRLSQRVKTEASAKQPSDG